MRLYLLVCLLTMVCRPCFASERLILFAGGGTKSIDGTPATALQLKEPFAIGFDSSQSAYILEMEKGQRIWRIDPQGAATRFAGTGEKGNGGDGGSATQAQFNGAHSLAIAPNDDIYIGDTWNCTVRRIEKGSGRISTVAGTGTKGFSGDGGPATRAQLGGAYAVALDLAGTQLILTDLPNLRVRAVDLKSGLIRTIAGNGQKGIPADGSLASNAPLVDPRAAAMDSQGQVYILERGGNALRVVDVSGRIRTVVNTSGAKGATGDGGPALHATLNGPKHICIDAKDNVIIADAENHLIRRFEVATGNLTRLAGNGSAGSAGLGGSPLAAQLNRPHGVYARPDGTIYIVDSYNDRVVRIRADRN